MPIFSSSTFVAFPDPEGQYYRARALAWLGNTEDALAAFDLAERGGFFCYPFFARDPWLDSLRTEFPPADSSVLASVSERFGESWENVKRSTSPSSLALARPAAVS